MTIAVFVYAALASIMFAASLVLRPASPALPYRSFPHISGERAIEFNRAKTSPRFPPSLLLRFDIGTLRYSEKKPAGRETKCNYAKETESVSGVTCRVFGSNESRLASDECVCGGSARQKKSRNAGGSRINCRPLQREKEKRREQKGRRMSRLYNSLHKKRTSWGRLITNAAAAGASDRCHRRRRRLPRRTHCATVTTFALTMPRP